MMYGDKLALAIKVNGTVLREFKDTVYLPFGAEYSILIKNLNTKRVQLNLTIDGQEMAKALVINAGQEIDLERSIANGNLNAGNKFKFIERTASIEQHRGVKLEDGLIRVEYQFEHVFQPNWAILGTPTWYEPHWTVFGGAKTTYTPNSNRTLRRISNGIGMNSANSVASADVGAISYNDAGITVPGSRSDQKFSTVSSFALEPEKHAMVIKLLGQTPDNKPVLQEVTVKSKPRCITCNKQNKATAKFCSACSTALEIFA